jgi:DNA-binding MarR family transcriptional regulator
MQAAGRDRSASLVVLAIVRAEARLSAEFGEALGRAGLTPPQFNVLMEVAVASGARLALHEICERLLKSPPNVTALVDRLERDGLLRRERNQDDRRVVMATLTERGWEALAAAAPEVFAAERRMLGDLSPAGRRELVQQLHWVARPPGSADRGRKATSG